MTRVRLEALRELNPKLVVCSISGCGQGGRLRDEPVFDLLAQTITGVMGLTGEPGLAGVLIGTFRRLCGCCDCSSPGRSHAIEPRVRHRHELGAIGP
ncbi:CoA transferase [Bradyrhizobium pachyrhizi]|uniref:CoA transferase n=1 Tax=Bradyrhizobium pachyrhizi TaxID=280333 RepID=UPI0009E5C793